MTSGKRYVDEIVLTEEPTEDYLSELSVVKYLVKHKRLRLYSPVTFFVGENGTGKSTLLEAIAVKYGFNAEGGTKNFNFSTCDTHSSLCDSISLVKRDFPRDGFFLRAESFYNVATKVDDYGAIDSYGYKSLHAQSHGESFLALFKNRFSGNGLYILDEPEAALSPMRQMSLLVIIDELVKCNSQFIISTHSPILLAYPNAKIYQLTEDGIALTDYKQTEHYAVTKAFLDDPEAMCRRLLDD